MIVLYLVVPLALMLAAVALWAFVRSAKRGQFDDLDTPPMRVLFDSESKPRDGPK